jgi:predicted Zn-dependent protease
LSRFPNDPEIVNAKANILLYYGKTKSDAQRAVTLLKTATEKFPNHTGIEANLAQAYRILQNEDQWVTISRDILRRFPLNSYERATLAQYYQEKNDSSNAIRLLEEGIKFSPLNGMLRHDLIELMFRNEKKEDAKIRVQESLKKIPEDVDFRQSIVFLLLRNGEDELALTIAKDGTEFYPDGAELWRIYGEALWYCRLNSDMQTVEQAYLNALKFNPRLLKAADRLAELYTYQNRFDEAKKICETQKPFHPQKGDVLTRLAWIERLAGHTSEAVNRIVEIVKQWPTNRWAWQLLLEWVEEDKEWSLARQSLKDVHPVMVENPDFLGNRLYVLHKAGVKDTETEAQWSQLLNDFPENETIHYQRFDVLYEDERLEAAGTVLSEIETFYPGSPYLLARKAALKADQNQFAEATSAALSLMNLPYDVGNWCQQKVWDAFQNHGQIPQLIQAALGEWEKGLDIEPTFFTILIQNIEQAFKKPTGMARILQKFGIQSALEKRLLGLLDQTLNRDDPSGTYTASILDKLVDIGKRNFLIKFSKKHPDFSQTRTKVWQVVGYALVTGFKTRRHAARQWLENWRSHPGCELWILNNYIIAIEADRNITQKEKLQLILENARKALKVLPLDHTTQYVVCKYCEAALRLDESDEFLAAALQYENILSDTESGYWREVEDPHLPWVILQFKRLLEIKETDSLQLLSKAFKSELANRKVGPWVRPEWKRYMQQIANKHRKS